MNLMTRRGMKQIRRVCAAVVFTGAFGLYAGGAVASAAPAVRASVHSDNVSGSVLAKSAVRTETFSGLGQVLPPAMLVLRANLTGQIEHARLSLGQTVKAGEVVGYLGGSALTAQIEQAKARLAAEEVRVKSAAATLALTQKTLKYQISTRATLLQAEQALGLAKAGRDGVQAELTRLEKGRVLRAPASGVVTAIEQLDGSLVQPGAVIARIEPVSGLRLRAEFYPTGMPGTPGTSSALRQIKPGMHGWFMPLGGHRKIAVAVVSVLPLDAQDGALPVVFRPVTPVPITSGPVTSQSVTSDKNAPILDAWQSGLMGQVVLQGAKHTVVTVPTQALILEQGQWWVLVRKGASWQRQAVDIGESHGETTDVTKGLKPGERVLVDQAYLEFHRDFGLRYQQPD